MCDLSIRGVRNTEGGNTQLQRFLNAKLACEAAKIGYPEELRQYFGSLLKESPETIKREMNEFELDESILRDLNEDYVDGVEIFLKDIPKEAVSIKIRVHY